MKGSRMRMQIELIGRKDSDAEIELAAYAVDAQNNIIESDDIDKNGNFKISSNNLTVARQVLIGPKVDKIDAANKKVFAAYRPHQFKAILEDRGVLEITRRDWYQWPQLKRCVSGSARHCSWWFLLASVKQRLTYEPLSLGLHLAQSQSQLKTLTATSALNLSEGITYAPAQLALPLVRPMRCEVICDGLVEVYRRTCCCHPWIIFDPRLPELIRELEDFVVELPPIPWPPRPQPDPPPWREQVLKNGAYNERVLNAAADLKALQSLSAEQIPAYINVRPWLCCHCGASTKVAHGTIRSDGDFNVCWTEYPYLLPINCHEEYAYVIKQNIDGVSTVIYDGRSANQWFRYTEDVTLTSYHPDAIVCRHDPFPDEEGAFVLLQDVGETGTYNLKTPDSTGWDRVATPSDYNDGLVYPASSPANAKGAYKDRNWGGTLKLRYHFSAPMKALGAKYYRVSVTAANASGNPIGTRKYLPVSQWRYYEVIGSDIYVRKQALGPHSAGTQHKLYEIPYDDDHDWQNGQYHALLNTRDYSNGRFLLTVEVFDAAGNLLRPNGTAAPAGVASSDESFTFRRWYQELGPTANVPFAALTHMLWWDNRKAEAKIVDFRKNGLANAAECQFIQGVATSKFSVGYRAYHPEPMFMLNHRMWWRRGLGGPTGALSSPYYNPDNVGVPPALPHESAQLNFSSMLGSHTKCSFSVNLHVNVKTFDGINTLDSLDDWDQGALALDTSGPCLPLAKATLAEQALERGDVQPALLNLKE